jgi:Rod binding domain-containing protein
LIPPVSGQDALPQVDRSAMPREVRKASAEDQKIYKTALAFERQLLTQLAESMNPEPQGDDEEQGDAAGGAYKSMVPQTMADALVARGGTGIALDLYRSMTRGGSK